MRVLVRVLLLGVPTHRVREEPGELPEHIAPSGAARYRSPLSVALMNKQKKKKQLTDVQESLYHELQYWKSLGLMYRAYSRLAHHLLQAELIGFPAKETAAYRYSNRLRIFEHCFFIKPVTYEEYLGRMNE